MKRGRRSIRRIIERALALWCPITGADRWTVALHWSDPRGELDGRTAGAHAQPEYFDADLTFDLAAEEKVQQSPEALSYEVLHELCHLLTWEMFKLALEHTSGKVMRDANERVTSQVARAIWVAKYGEEPPA